VCAYVCVRVKQQQRDLNELQLGNEDLQHAAGRLCVCVCVCVCVCACVGACTGVCVSVCVQQQQRDLNELQ